MTRLLIIEDRFLVAEAMKTSLIRGGYDIVGTTGSPEAALRLAARERPELALVDVFLSDSGHAHLDGVALASRLRRDLGVPSLFVTASPQFLQEDEGLGCVAKPCGEAQLAGAIEASLRLIEADDLPERLPDGVKLWRRREGPAAPGATALKEQAYGGLR